MAETQMTPEEQQQASDELGRLRQRAMELRDRANVYLGGAGAAATGAAITFLPLAPIAVIASFFAFWRVRSLLNEMDKCLLATDQAMQARDPVRAEAALACYVEHEAIVNKRGPGSFVMKYDFHNHPI